MIFPGEHLAPVMLSAVRNFTENYPDSRASLSLSAYYNSTSQSVYWATYLFFGGSTPPEGLFSEFLAQNWTLNEYGPKSYLEAISFADDTVITGESVQIAGETTPLPSAEYGAEVFGSYLEHFLATAKSQGSSIPGLTLVFTFQPIPKRLASQSIAAGGDILSLDDKHDRIMFEINTWSPAVKYDVQVAKLIKDIFDGVKQRVDGFVKEKKLVDAYRPLFMNDANWQQDFFGRIRAETRTFLKAVRAKYDSDGFFTRRTGGFKF